METRIPAGYFPSCCPAGTPSNLGQADNAIAVVVQPQELSMKS